MKCSVFGPHERVRTLDWRFGDNAFTVSKYAKPAPVLRRLSAAIAITIADEPARYLPTQSAYHEKLF